MRPISYNECVLCRRSGVDVRRFENPREKMIGVGCPVCGRYYIEEKLSKTDLPIETEIKLRWYIRTETEKVFYWDTETNQWEAKEGNVADKKIITITKDNIDKELNSVPYPTSLLDKIDIVVEHFYKNTKFFHQNITINLKNDYILFFCKNNEELQEILVYLTEKYIDGDGAIRNNDEWRSYLLPEGIKRIEELNKETKSYQCFVAMWFSGKTENAYSEAMEKAIEEDSGYESYKVSNNDQNNGWIPDTIVKEIRRSKFVIADLTGYRAGVYYEAGFAEGLGKEVIYTCNKNWFDEQEEMMKIPIQCSNCSGTNELKLDGVHFNLKQRKMILWEEDNLPDFRKALAERIGAVIGINEKKKT